VSVHAVKQNSLPKKRLPTSDSRSANKIISAVLIIGSPVDLHEELGGHSCELSPMKLCRDFGGGANASVEAKLERRDAH
jgi:hypothetical protein